MNCSLLKMKIRNLNKSISRKKLEN